jgi:hypothetical protein
MKILFFIAMIAAIAAVVIWMREKRKNKISARPSESQKKDDDMTHILMPAGGDGDFRGLVYQNSGIITEMDTGAKIALSNLNDGFNGTLELRAICIDIAENQHLHGSSAPLTIDIAVVGGKGFNQTSVRVQDDDFAETPVDIDVFIENKDLAIKSSPFGTVVGYRNITITAKD